MSIILDALKKAQEERKGFGKNRPFSGRHDRERSHWPLYVIALLVLSVAVAIVLIPGPQKAAKTLPRVEVTPPQPPQPSQGVEKEKEATAASGVAPAPEERKPQEQLRTAAAYTVPVTEKKSPNRTKRTSETKPREKPRRAAAVVNHERIARLYNNAVAEADKGNTAAAVTLYEAILAEHPSHIESLNNLGVLAMAEGRRKEAISCFSRILQLKTDYGKAYNNLGLLMMQNGDNRLAEEYFRKGMEIEKDSIEPALNLAALLRNEKRYEEANRLLEGLISAGARNKSLYLSSALIKDEMGRHEEAIGYYKAYLREGGSPGERNKVIERLKVLDQNQPSKTP